MSTLFLVRHAQASFLEEDYDVLSELGHTQARLLGQRWARLGLALDAVYTGPLRRQRHTAELVGEEMARAGLPWPEIQQLDALDEYHAEPMLRRFVPEVAEQDSEVRRLLQALTEASTRGERARAFERLFQGMMRRWARGAFGARDVESWEAFRRRAQGALATLADPDRRSARVAAFTSGGAIGVAVGALVGAEDETMLDLGWTLNNCSVSEVLFSRARRNLARYNDISHLEDPEHWTHR
jgi:broad specificity phosphatase PhoE